MEINEDVQKNGPNIKEKPPFLKANVIIAKDLWNETIKIIRKALHIFPLDISSTFISGSNPLCPAKSYELAQKSLNPYLFYILTINYNCNTLFT